MQYYYNFSKAGLSLGLVMAAYSQCGHAVPGGSPAVIVCLRIADGTFALAGVDFLSDLAATITAYSQCMDLTARCAPRTLNDATLCDMTPVKGAAASAGCNACCTRLFPYKRSPARKLLPPDDGGRPVIETIPGDIIPDPTGDNARAGCISQCNVFASTP